MPTFMTTRIFSASLGGTAVLLSALAIACGPELTDVGTVDLTGVWHGKQSVGVITDIRLELVQDENGRISGTWHGKATPPPSGCPPELGDRPTNTVSGRATVAQVELEILGAGNYFGAAITPALLRGRIDSCDDFHPLDFELVSRAVAR